MEGHHFSPRPNRADEINWSDWDTHAFEQAAKSQKPVLLSISGSWCHWCHVMDETSYSDADIIKLINEQFVPVRVDTDKRPDINDRYNLGGWPTTAALTPGGELIAGGTYIPPKHLERWLRKVADTWTEHAEDVEEVLARREPPPRPGEPIDASIYRAIADRIAAAYDRLHGGFGRGTKFPMVDAILLALRETQGGDGFWREVVTTTLDGMADRGMYDHVAGGFFRYSTTRDWSIPHFEKMLEDNAGLLEVLAATGQSLGEQRYLDVCQDVLRYLNASLRQDDPPCWSGSQDADEAYYAADAAGRASMAPPYIDRTMYVNWNGLAARAYLAVAAALKTGQWEQQALDTLSFILERCLSQDGSVHHYYLEGKAHLPGLLDDQVSVGHALLAAYQRTRHERWLRASEDLARWCLDHLQTESGAFRDRLPAADDVGALARPRYDLEDNAKLARWFVELDGHRPGRYLTEARRALDAFASDYRAYGLMAATYALAVDDVLRAQGRPGLS